MRHKHEVADSVVVQRRRSELAARPWFIALLSRFSLHISQSNRCVGEVRVRKTCGRSSCSILYRGSQGPIDRPENQDHQFSPPHGAISAITRLAVSAFTDQAGYRVPPATFCLCSIKKAWTGFPPSFRARPVGARKEHRHGRAHKKLFPASHGDHPI